MSLSFLNNHVSVSVLGSILKASLVIAILLSFYVFLNVIVFDDKSYETIYSTWQFPMLFALFFEMHYGYRM